MARWNRDVDENYDFDDSDDDDDDNDEDDDQDHDEDESSSGYDSSTTDRSSDSSTNGKAASHGNGSKRSSRSSGNSRSGPAGSHKSGDSKRASEEPLYEEHGYSINEGEEGRPSECPEDGGSHHQQELPEKTTCTIDDASMTYTATTSHSVQLAVSSSEAHHGSQSLVAIVATEDASGRNMLPVVGNMPKKQSSMAIVGMSGSSATTISHEPFWHLLENRTEVHRPLPAERLSVGSHLYSTSKKGDTSPSWFSNFIEHPGLFDARFFDISSREATQPDWVHQPVTPLPHVPLLKDRFAKRKREKIETLDSLLQYWYLILRSGWLGRRGSIG
jgi:hypothetical protein